MGRGGPAMFTPPYLTISRCPKPVIARVNGYAIGGGHHFAYFCDFTIAAEHAVFGQSEPRVAYPASGPTVNYLTRIVGHKRAREIWMLGRRYSAKQMMDWGLVNHLYQSTGHLLFVLIECFDKKRSFITKSVIQARPADAKPLHQPNLDEVPRDGLIVLLDQVTDPHNVGAIMRSCAAFNVSAVVVTARHSADASGVFFKAASGAFEHVPYVTVTNLARAIDELKDYGFHIVGLDSEAEVSMADVPKVRPLALILGAEGKGLRHLTVKSCDQVAKLDMPGAIKSLNVSIATAVSLYALTH